MVNAQKLLIDLGIELGLLKMFCQSSLLSTKFILSVVHNSLYKRIKYVYKLCILFNQNIVYFVSDALLGVRILVYLFREKTKLVNKICV